MRFAAMAAPVRASLKGRRQRRNCIRARNGSHLMVVSTVACMQATLRWVSWTGFWLNATSSREDPMKLGTPLLGPALAALGCLLSIDTAAAQTTRTWVSGVGDDVNPCSRTAPCKTFAGAISKTATGGEINCLDPGGYGTLTITKSITVSCKYTHGSTLNSGGINGFVINNADAGNPVVDVVLRGISINGAGTAPGLNGIRFVKGTSLTVDDVHIQNARSGNGIHIENTDSHVRIAIINTVIESTGNGATGAGIQINPKGSGSAEVSIDNTQLIGNTVGVRVDATNTTGVIDAVISNSAAKHNRFHGFVAIGGANGRVRMMLDGVVASNNKGEGVRVVNPNGNVRIGRSTVTYNGIGIVTDAGGNLRSYGDNFIDGNTNDGVLPITSPQK
jgi:hypothetical protein